MASLIQIAYGSRVRRQGRSRRALPNQRPSSACSSVRACSARRATEREVVAAEGVVDEARFKAASIADPRGFANSRAAPPLRTGLEQRARAAYPGRSRGRADRRRMGRLTGLRRLAHGLLAGVLLSGMRAPLGFDWTQLAVVQGTTAALFRAAALLAVALSLDPARPALQAGVGAGWLAAVCAGYALHGLVIDLTPESRAGYAFLLHVGTVLLCALAGKRVRGPEGSLPERLKRNERLGLVLIGLGSALALETLAHELRLFTMATSADDTVVGSVLLLLLALSAAAFAPLALRLASERLRVSAGLALGGAATVAGLVLLAQLSPDGLHA